MKNHVAVKFIAVMLAALSLLGVVSSTVGIVALTGMDLYTQSVAQLREQQLESKRREFAVQLAHRYASLELGQLPEDYLDSYWGNAWYYDTFNYGSFFYEIRNEHGTVVESTLDGEPAEDAAHYSIQVTNILFHRLVHDLPETGNDSADTASQPPETDGKPESDVSSGSAAKRNETGDDTAGDTGEEDSTDLTKPAEETASAGEDPVDTEQVAEPQSQKSAWIIDSEQDIQTDWYWDSEQGAYVELQWQYARLPPYTVELYLLSDAVQDEYMWTLLEGIWNVRYQLFYVLVLGLLCFAALMVYLCCAAGRKPGREELRADGLNRLPLDLYLVADIVGIVAAVYMCSAYAEYLVRNMTRLALPVVLVVGYCCSLPVVGFLFALAAQFKMPGGFWWRDTVICGCCRLIVRILRWCWRCLKKLVKTAPAAVKAIFRVLKKCLLGVFSLVKKLVLVVWGWIRGLFQWITKHILRIYGLLPLTWQWLLTAFITIVLVCAAFACDSLGWTLLLLGTYLAIVLYGAQSFGTLAEGTKRMSSGDLDSKVEDKLLVGAFRDFAGDLNDLSQVAVVAAQKQMKAERMKTELITNVSHDIKTPLTSIINYVDLMQKPHSPEEQEAYLEVLSRQSYRLKKLIDDLMEMSKASTGNLAVEITRINAAEAVNQALGEFADKLERADLTPVFRVPEKQISMWADGRLAWRVLSNLLNNAVKYALPGTRLYIDLMELEGKVVISLKNISRDELNVSADELLERFVRGDSSRNTEGSGLGLNIAQSLMELQKGQLQLLVDGDLFKVTLIFPAG